MVQWDPTRCRLSPGKRIEALVLNILAGRTPLYRVAEFYEDTATGVLFGEDILPEHLTDDCLARALDKLAASRPRAVYSAVALRACMFEGIDTDFGHFDTTSISLFGEYSDLQPEDIQLVRGYSKDGHPELKQLVLSLLCNRQGIPIWAEPRDGNSQDNEANRDAIDDFCGAFSPERLRETAWIADSKLVTGPNLARISELGLRFLSRLPESFKAATTAKLAALDGAQWEDLGQIADAPRLTSAHYRASEQTVEIEGRTYRAVVVHSDHLEARKRHTCAKRLGAQRAALEKALQALGRQRFSCQADAQAAVGALLKRVDRGPFRLQVDVSSVLRTLPLGHRGRRRKDEPVQQVEEFVVSGTIGEPDPLGLEREQQLQGMFVLISNLEDRKAFSAQRLLEEYRDQGVVEHRFAFIKDPKFVDGLYLHTPRRLEALAYVIVMACLVFSVFERRVRLALAAAKQKILLPGKKWSERPTGKMLLDLVGRVAVCRTPSGPWRVCSPPHMTARAAQVVTLAGFNFEAIYTGVAARPSP
jgi:transposase